MQNVCGWSHSKDPSSGCFEIYLVYGFGDCGLYSWPELDTKMSNCGRGAESLV